MRRLKTETNRREAVHLVADTSRHVVDAESERNAAIVFAHHLGVSLRHLAEASGLPDIAVKRIVERKPPAPAVRPVPTIHLRLVDSMHHSGLLYTRLEQAGLTIIRHGFVDATFDVEGDPAAVQGVVERWDGEGRVVLGDGP